MSTLRSLALSATASALLAGCSVLETSTPVVPMKADLQRKDFEVIGGIKGHSQTTYILAGLFQIVDDEFTLLGWQIFNDSGYMTLAGPADPLNASATTIPYLTNPDFTNVHSRAMYRAYCQAPDADAVYDWSFLRNANGVPLIWRTVDITARAHAIRIKPESRPTRPGVVPEQIPTELPVTKAR